MRSSRAFLCLGLIALLLFIVQPIPIHNNHYSSAPNHAESNLPSPAQTIWDNRSFWAVDYDLDVYYIIDSYLLAFGNHCYIYFEDSVITALGVSESIDRAELYRDDFETNIYERVTDLAGNPNGTLGDIDGDPRIYILIMQNRMSCYRQTNEIEAEHSNLCEMIYVCYYSYNVLQTIAHEFHHLVWFNYEFDEVHFILEGVAEYAMYYTGCCPADNLTNRVPYFINDIHDSLIYFEVEAQDYGACYLFAFYLVEQYGLQFLRDLVQQEDDGALGLESALIDAGYNITFNDLYLDWMTALTIDEPGFANDRYCYRDIATTHHDYTTIDMLPFQEDGVPLYCYGSKVYRMPSPPDYFSVEISQPADAIAGVSVAYRDTFGWHVVKMQNQGRALVQVYGESIDTVHIIVSYLFVETPNGAIDFGSGYLESVNVSVYENDEPTTTLIPITTTTTYEPNSTESTSTPSPSIPITTNVELIHLIVIGGIPFIITIVVLVLFIRRRTMNLEGTS